MLILTRRPSESIFINDRQIKITILGVNKRQVKIGIDAPKEISVHREEVFLRIKDENHDSKREE